MCKLCIAEWANLVMGPVEHMAPETLRAVLKQTQPAGQASSSSAADIFSLGVVLRSLATGHLPFAHSSSRSCTLGPATAGKRAKGIAKQHRQWQVSSCTVQQSVAPHCHTLR